MNDKEKLQKLDCPTLGEWNEVTEYLTVGPGNQTTEDTKEKLSGNDEPMRESVNGVGELRREL